MAKFRVRARTFYQGQLYEPGDPCDSSVARALGDDAEPVEDGAIADESVELPPARAKKPIRKASVK
jgi:hypothetical protein